MKKIKNIGLLLIICSLILSITMYNKDIYIVTNELIQKKEANENIDVSYDEKPVFSNITAQFTTSEIENANVAKLGTTSSLAYMDTSLFKNKRITKIGIPVKEVAALDGNQTFSLSIINSTASPFEYVKKYTLKLPQDQLGSSTTINKWIYVDLSHYDIVIGENETLSFGNGNDTVKWAYKVFNSVDENKYNFINSSMEWDNEKQLSSVNGMLFDVYTSDLPRELGVDELNKLSEKTTGLNISILGDSISTFTGYSNNGSYNTTLTTNNNCYGTTNTKRYVIDVNQTWWKQAINKTSMKLLVNNSSGGDAGANSKNTRGAQLRCDTGDDKGTKPDIIAVYLGTNDARAGDSLQVFEENYKNMINTLTESYPDAKIFFFTILPTEKDIDEDAYNNVIRNIVKNSNNDNFHLVDLYKNSGITANNQSLYQGDNLHPNITGMDLITSTFMEGLADAYLNVKEDNENNDNIQEDENKNEESNNENQEEVENPFTSTSLIKIISLILIVGSIIVLISTLKNTKINKYE